MNWEIAIKFIEIPNSGSVLNFKMALNLTDMQMMPSVSLLRKNLALFYITMFGLYSKMWVIFFFQIRLTGYEIQSVTLLICQPKLQIFVNSQRHIANFTRQLLRVVLVRMNWLSHNGLKIEKSATKGLKISYRYRIFFCKNVDFSHWGKQCDDVTRKRNAFFRILSRCDM